MINWKRKEHYPPPPPHLPQKVTIKIANTSWPWIFEPQPEKTQTEVHQWTQISLHICTVWSIFIVHMKQLCILDYLKCAQWRFWSDCSNVQADWIFAGHTCLKVCLLTLQLICTITVFTISFGQTCLSKQCRPRWDAVECGISLGLHCLPLIQQFLDTTSGS